MTNNCRSIIKVPFICYLQEMSDDNRNWWDKPSRDGMGIWQDFRGVPNNLWDSKGDVHLKLQKRIAESSEQAAETLSKLPIVQADNSESLDEMREAIQAELVDFNDELSHLNDGTEERHEELMDGIAEANSTLDDISDTGRRISGKLTGLLTGTGDVALTARRIERSMGSLRSTAVAILKTNEGVLEGIEDINWALDELADLAVESIREQIRSRKEIKEVIRNAVQDILTFGFMPQ